MKKSTMFFRTLLVLCCAFSPAAASLNNETDLLSLLAIKSVLQDPLRSLTSWNQTTHFCNWTGIRCGHRHPDRVISINLRSYGLVGSISPHVGNLTFLKTIILINNTFHGPIPQEISLLRRLELVDCSYNFFVGAIPRNLSTALLYLNLINNKLSGSIPTELSSMFKLELLGLGSNKLSGSDFLQSIGNLTSLKHLSLKSCSLKGEIPAFFAQLEMLEFLQLSENGLNGNIPTALFNFSKLHTFQVSSNQLEGILPSSLGLKLPNLAAFTLSDNKFRGPIPASISNASSLKYLELHINYFTGKIPISLGRLSHLQWLGISSNRIEDDIKFISLFINSTYLQSLQVDDNLLTGSLPDSIANFSSQLSLLTLSANKIGGEIPSAIGNLIGLTVIEFSLNHLEGSIPNSITKLSNLQYFAAFQNRFTGEFPSSFGNLSSLTKMFLFQNKFSGELPPSMGNCTNLIVIDISHNNFSGLIPPQILSISTLSIYLDLSYNLFEGSIPNEIGSLRNLRELDLANNKLSGRIPESLGRCSSLEIVDMPGNLLEGEIPSALSALTGLQYLSLSQNNLSGPIPSFLGKLHLQYLNLSFNRLQGEVPTIGIFKNKTSCSLEGNKELCGGIPELKLTPCPRVHSHKKSSSSLLKILIPSFAAGGILITLFAFKYKQRMYKKGVTPSLSSFTGVQIMRLSYADLLRATSEFSETNLLGFGKFGSVYKGILDDEQHTQIAVKALNLSVRGASRSFMAECSVLRNVRHRNLLKILSVCESIDFQGNEFKALVYEFMSNGSLDKWLHQGEQNVNLKQRLNIALDIAQGIEYLHSGTELCIVHGDLKPSNILLDHDMSAYVGDFGLSKFVSDIIPSHESSSSIGIRGTIGYVPPEYGMSCPVSVQGDSYSYGIILLEMFTNKRPTDDDLESHVNLHSFVSAALPDRIMEVVVPQFQTHMNDDKIVDCLTAILSIGVSCSKEIPRERMTMTNAVNELHKIQKMSSKIR